ncbi:MAG: hypothetical protein WDO69_24410 [Pseudomonadota bacterium]
MNRSQRARRARDRHAATAPHYTRADIGTVYVSDQLRITVDAAERLGTRPKGILVGDTSPMNLLAPNTAQPALAPKAARNLAQLLALR